MPTLQELAGYLLVGCMFGIVLGCVIAWANEIRNGGTDGD